MNAITIVHRRPGAFWKILQFPLTRIVLASASIVACILLVSLALGALGAAPRSAFGVAASLVGSAAATAVYVANVRILERREVAELHLRGAAGEALMGLSIGAALFCTTMAILCLLGTWTITDFNDFSVIGYPLASAVSAAFTEELLLRGVFFRIVEESLGSWFALGSSAALFGVLHGWNPGATAVSTMAIALEAGVLLAAAYMYARRLWMPIALHFAWNFTEGGIFGTNVSGTDSKGLLSIRFDGPDLLTGGAFGPEASLVAVLVCLVMGTLFIVRAWRAKQVVQPFWRRA